LQVTAEGVETAEQLAFLRERGCDEAQGFYFSRPLPAHELARLLGGERQMLSASGDAGGQGR
jgi:EAL domain-containing protein (putative c-di-GMP-specific phosphodiesterase class I)